MFKFASLTVLAVAATALLLPSAGAFFKYKTKNPECPVHQEVQVYNKTIQVKEIVVVEEPINVPIYHLKTVYETTVLPLTSYLFHTVTAQPLRIQVTETRVVTTNVAIPQTRVRTLTTSVIHTVVQVFTETATNYHSAFDTVSLHETRVVEAIEVETVVAEVIKTAVHTISSTLLLTEQQTSQVVETVAEVAGTSTVFLPRYHTSTHTLTKMVTNTYCPPPLEGDHVPSSLVY